MVDPFVMAHDGVQSLPEAVRAVHDWAPGKWQFTDAQIELAAERLHAEGWFEVSAAVSYP